MSYNNLLTDPDLVARWNGDANGDGTGDANDVQGTYNGTWTGTAAYTDPPTGKGDGKAFDFDGSSYVSAGAHAEVGAGDPWSISFWFRTVTPSSFDDLWNAGGGTHPSTDRIGYGTAGPPDPVLFFGNQSLPNSTTFGTFARNEWHFLTATHDGTGNWAVLTDGAELTTGFRAGIAWTAFTFGGRAGGAQPVVDIYDPRLHTRVITESEHAELYAGPEPTYTSGATLAANGAYDVGTWDAQSNGTATYEWVVEADGTVVDSGAGATGTADFGATTGLLTLLVRASNDGGYDVGDFATRTSGYGSSGDGYYEVASVTAVAADGLYSSVYPSLAGSVY